MKAITVRDKITEQFFLFTALFINNAPRVDIKTLDMDSRGFVVNCTACR